MLIRARRDGELQAVTFGRAVRDRESDLAARAEANLDAGRHTVSVLFLPRL
jgi:hypothetical protein